jgi:hypothetical protein
MNNRLLIIMIQVTLQNQAFESSYTIVPDAQEHTFENAEIADTVKACFIDGIMS